MSAKKMTLKDENDDFSNTSPFQDENMSGGRRVKRSAKKSSKRPSKRNSKKNSNKKGGNYDHDKRYKKMRGGADDDDDDDDDEYSDDNIEFDREAAQEG